MAAGMLRLLTMIPALLPLVFAAPTSGDDSGDCGAFAPE